MGGFGRGGPIGVYYEEIWMIPGPLTGRGPKGHQRSNDRIKEDVCGRLTQHGQLDAGNIEVSVEQGEVTLEGTVDGRQAKRMAEDAAEGVLGVKDVHNRLRVRGKQASPSATPSRVLRRQTPDHAGECRDGALRRRFSIARRGISTSVTAFRGFDRHPALGRDGRGESARDMSDALLQGHGHMEPERFDRPARFLGPCVSRRRAVAAVVATAALARTDAAAADPDRASDIGTGLPLTYERRADRVRNR
jgi:hypothetical protein